MRSNLGKSVFVGLIVFSLILSVAAQAAEKEEPNSFVKFWRGVFHWPFSATKESANVVVDTTKKGAETITQEGKDIGGTLTGDSEAAKDLLVNPVKGTAETAKTAVEGTAGMPEKATKEAWPSK